MMITVKRKKDAPRVVRHSVGDLPTLEFAHDQEIFDVPFRRVEELASWFEVCVAGVVAEEKAIGNFILGKGKKKED